MHEPVTCIIGVHGSGSSLVARWSNLLGIYLGDQERMVQVPLDDTERVWEHRGIVEMNNRILAQLGGSHLQPPQLQAGWEKSSDLGKLRDDARQIIANDFNGVPSWGWKDPRACLTLPFWQELLPNMRYVLCFRNPFDVALSLTSRDGISFENAVDLWLVHVTELLAATQNQARHFICYEDLSSDWRGHFKRLGEFLNGSDFEAGTEAYLQAASSVETMLRDDSTSFLDVVSEPRLALDAKALYIGIRVFASHSAKQNVDQLLFDELIESLAAQCSHSARQKWAQAQNLGTRGLQEAEQECQALKKALEESGRVQGILQRKSRELESKLEDARARLSSLSKANSALEAVLETSERTIRELKLRRDEHLRAINELRQSLSAVHESLAWKLVGKARAAKDSLLPHGSAPRRLFDIAVRKLKNAAPRQSRS